MKKNNLILTMQHFGKLSPDERALFLSVISSENEEKKKKDKPKVKKHPYNEEYFYQLLKKNHNKEVRQRLQKMKEKDIEIYNLTTG